MTRHLTLSLGLLALTACFPRAAPPPGQLSASAIAAGTTRWPDATHESLEEGRQLFVKSCGECHSHPALDAVAQEKWPKVMTAMARKADLTPDQGELMLRFVLASMPPPAATP